MIKIHFERRGENGYIVVIDCNDNGWTIDTYYNRPGNPVPIAYGQTSDVVIRRLVNEIQSAEGNCRLTMHMADNHFFAVQIDGGWRVLSVDDLTTIHATSDWITEWLIAVVILMIDDMATEYYPTAETAIAGWQPECRPIP